MKDNITHNYHFKTFLNLHYFHETKDTEEIFYVKQSSGCVSSVTLIAVAPTAVLFTDHVCFSDTIGILEKCHCKQFSV